MTDNARSSAGHAAPQQQQGGEPKPRRTATPSRRRMATRGPAATTSRARSATSASPTWSRRRSWPEPAARSPTTRATDSVGGVEHPEELSDADFERLEDRVDDVEQAIEDGDEVETTSSSASSTRAAAAAPARATVAGRPTKRGPARFAAFLRASWAELQRVQWPDRRQVGQATAVVLGFVVVAGVYLGLADALANEIVDFII